MGLCFAPGCDHTNKSGCKMFNFPKDIKLKEKWEQLVRRGDRKANKFSLICSCHFKDGNKDNLPSVFKHNIGKQFNYPSPEKKKRRSIPKKSDDESIPSTSSASLYKSMPTSSHVSGEVIEERPESGMSSATSLERSTSRNTQVSSSSSVEAENYFLKQEIEELQSQLEKLHVAFSFKHIENNDKLVLTYTGLPDTQIFLTVYKYLNKQTFKYYSGWSVVNIPRIDQLLMTLMKLRLNLLHEDLAVRFNCSVGTVTNIILTWLHVMHVCLYEQFLKNNVPSREKNRSCLPSSFSPFTNCKMVIDCTEVYTAVPKRLDKQRSTYSNYKHRNTLKGLVGVAPNGTLTYISNLYVGSTSDKRIVQHSGIFSHFIAGDLILADKGFLISDILPPGVSLNIPPFLVKSQFSPAEVQQTLVIARARIHVERVISRIKNFKILSYIPSNMRQYASKIFQVCGVLTTLNYPLIREVGDMFESI